MEKFDFRHPAHNFALYCLSRIYYEAPTLVNRSFSSEIIRLLHPETRYSWEDKEEIDIEVPEVHPEERWNLQPFFRANIEMVAKFLDLSVLEKDFLVFSVTFRSYPAFYFFMREVWDDMPFSQLVLLFSLLFDADLYEVEKVLSNQSRLSLGGLVEFEVRNYSLDIEMSSGLVSHFCRQRLSSEEIFEGSLKRAPKPRLIPSDFDYLSEFEIIKAYLKTVIGTGKPGSHLLIYGPPGSGKTELVRLMAFEIGADLYEPTYNFSRGKWDEMDRFFAYRIGNYLLRGQRAFMLFDDADTFLNRLVDKGWFNRVLEEAGVPTVWICNRTEEIDPALIRRFDLVVRMNYLPQEARLKMLRFYLGDLLGDEEKTERWLHRASQKVIPPAVASKTRDVLKLIREDYAGDHAKAATLIMNHTLELMGLDKI